MLEAWKIKAVENHFNENAEYQGVHVTATAYYNPERNEGILLVPNVNQYYLQYLL